MSRTNPKSYSRSTTSRREVMDSLRSNARSSRRSRPPALVPRPMSRQAANYADTALATYACNTTGSIVQLNVVPQSVATTGRIGKKIKMKSLQCKGLLQADTNTVYTQASYAIVYDRRPSGALPAITDIFDSISPNAFLNDTNSTRFKILKREDFALIGTVNTSTQTDKSAYVFDWYYRFPEKYANVSYKALGTGAIADVDEGAVYLVTMGSAAAGTGDGLLNAGFRLRFYDTSG